MNQTKEQFIKAGGSDSTAGCLMAMMGYDLKDRLISWAQNNIPESELTGDGLEDEPHVTILYGFNTDFDTAKLKEFMSTSEPVALILGSVSRFECPEYDVLKIDIDSPYAERLHGEIDEEFRGETKSSQHEYHPHLTLAYVNKGSCKELDGREDFNGEAVMVDSLLYSLPKKEGREEIELAGVKASGRFVRENDLILAGAPRGNRNAAKDYSLSGSRNHWMSPDGKLFDAGPAGGHVPWAQKNIPGITSRRNDGVYSQATDKGWVRIIKLADQGKVLVDAGYSKGKFGVLNKDHLATLENIAIEKGIPIHDATKGEGKVLFHYHGKIESSNRLTSSDVLESIKAGAPIGNQNAAKDYVGTWEHKTDLTVKDIPEYVDGFGERPEANVHAQFRKEQWDSEKRGVVAYLSGDKPLAEYTHGDYKALTMNDSQCLFLKKDDKYPAPAGQWQGWWDPDLKEVCGISKSDYGKMTYQEKARADAKVQAVKYAHGEFEELKNDFWKRGITASNALTSAAVLATLKKLYPAKPTSQDVIKSIQSQLPDLDQLAREIEMITAGAPIGNKNAAKDYVKETTDNVEPVNDYSLPERNYWLSPKGKLFAADNHSAWAANHIPGVNTNLGEGVYTQASKKGWVRIVKSGFDDRIFADEQSHNKSQKETLENIAVETKLPIYNGSGNLIYHFPGTVESSLAHDIESIFLKAKSAKKLSATLKRHDQIRNSAEKIYLRHLKPLFAGLEAEVLRNLRSQEATGSVLATQPRETGGQSVKATPGPSREVVRAGAPMGNQNAAKERNKHIVGISSVGYIDSFDSSEDPSATHAQFPFQEQNPMTTRHWSYHSSLPGGQKNVVLWNDEPDKDDAMSVEDHLHKKGISVGSHVASWSARTKYFDSLSGSFAGISNSVHAVDPVDPADTVVQPQPETFNFSLEAFTKKFQEAMAAAATEAFEEVGPALAFELGIGERETPEGIVRDFISTRANKIAGCPDVIFDAINKVLKEGIDNGDPFDEIADDIQEKFKGISKDRAMIIAQTEAHSTYGTAQMDSLKAAKFSTKKWCTSEDELVRDEHNECEDQGAIPNEEGFLTHHVTKHGVEEETIMYPGDPDASAWNVIGCRCFIVPGNPEEGMPDDDDEDSVEGSYYGTYLTAGAPHGNKNASKNRIILGVVDENDAVEHRELSDEDIEEQKFQHGDHNWGIRKIARWRYSRDACSEGKKKPNTVSWTGGRPTDDQTNAVDNHLYKIGIKNINHFTYEDGQGYFNNGQYITAGAPLFNQNAAKDKPISDAIVAKLLDKRSLTPDEERSLGVLYDNPEAAKPVYDLANKSYNEIDSMMKEKGADFDHEDLRRRLLINESIWNGEPDKIWPMPVYVSADKDENTIGLLLRQDGKMEMFEGNEEATDKTLDHVNKLMNVGDEQVEVWGSHTPDVTEKLRRGEYVPGIFVSPKKEVAEGYWGPGRELVKVKIPRSRLAQHSDVDWQIRNEPVKAGAPIGNKNASKETVHKVIGNVGHSGRVQSYPVQDGEYAIHEQYNWDEPASRGRFRYNDQYGPRVSWDEDPNGEMMDGVDEHLEKKGIHNVEHHLAFTGSRNGAILRNSKGEDFVGASIKAGAPIGNRNAAKDNYREKFLKNISETSRTATSGKIDTSSAKEKQGSNLSQDALKEQTANNAVALFEHAHAHKDDDFSTPDKVEQFVTDANRLANRGVSEHALRSWDGPGGNGWHKAAEVPQAAQKYYSELSRRLGAGEDPVKTAAWHEQEFDQKIHPFADGVGRTSKAVSAMILMRGNKPLPDYPDRKEYYSHAGDSHDEFENFYRKTIKAGAPVGNRNAAKDHVNEINPEHAEQFKKLSEMSPTERLKSMVDDMRSECKDGQIEFSGSFDSRMFVIAAAGEQPLKDATSFLKGELPVKEVPAPDWAKPFVEGGHHPGCCYDTSGRFVADLHSWGDEITDKAELVHGFIGNKETTAGFGHGWVEIGDKTVFDGVNQKFYDKEDYYAKLGAIPEQRYTPAEACKQMLKRKFYGPWGNTLGITNITKGRKRK